MDRRCGDGKLWYVGALLEMWVTRNCQAESEAQFVRGKPSLGCFDVYISTTYTEREKGEKPR